MPPTTGWREGTTGPLGNKAVDMMDNARALPTCPQRQQIAASLRNGRMIEAETETAEIPIKKTAQVVLPMGSTSNFFPRDAAPAHHATPGR